MTGTSAAGEAGLAEQSHQFESFQRGGGGGRRR
jgi:hypothetical protein